MTLDHTGSGRHLVPTGALQTLEGFNIGSNAISRHNLAHSCNRHEIVIHAQSTSAAGLLLTIYIAVLTHSIGVNFEEISTLRASINSRSQTIAVHAFAI